VAKLWKLKLHMKQCWIWSSRGSEYEERGPLGCTAMRSEDSPTPNPAFRVEEPLLVSCLAYSSILKAGVTSSSCNARDFSAALPFLLAFPFPSLPYSPLLFSPFPFNQSLGRGRLRLSCRGIGLCLHWRPHLSPLNLVLWTFWSGIFYMVAQCQWTW
jgi:hypothetical protein